MEIEDYDTLLVPPANRSSRDTVHIPDPDETDVPLCGTELRTDRTYNERAPEQVPDQYSLCLFCDPDHERDCVNTGAGLHQLLEDADPDEVEIA